MNKTEMKEQIFEVMLKTAVEESFERELKAFPKEKDLTDEYELSQPAKEKIEKTIRQTRHRSSMRRMGKIAKRAAIVLAIVIPVSLGSLLSVEASRNAIFNAFLNLKSDHADIQYQEETSSSAQASSTSGSAVVLPAYVPAGFQRMQAVKNDLKTETIYQNSNGDKIILQQGPFSPFKKGEIAGVDTEHTTLKKITINGQEASLFTANSKGENSYLAWQDHSSNFLLVSAIDPEELIKMAASMGQ